MGLNAPFFVVENKGERSKDESGKWKVESLCQASESQVYLSFYSERSQGSSP